MRTTDVANAYNIRREYFRSELHKADRATRAKLTRAILNTDLSAMTYETLLKLLAKFDDFDQIKITKTEQKSLEINEWVLNLSNNTAWISDIKNPSRLSNLKLRFESIRVDSLEQRELFQIFYSTYINIILVVLEDALIRMYIVEDIESLANELNIMLTNLTKLNPMGGLYPIIEGLLNITSDATSTNDDPHIEFIDTYAHTSFVWSQCAQLISDFISSIETNDSISLENANSILRQRMTSIVSEYKTF